MATPAKTVAKGLGKSFKNTLDLPFKLQWPIVSHDIASQILSELESSLKGLDIMPKKKRKRKRVEVDSEVEVEHVSKRQCLDTGEPLPSSVDEGPPPVTPTPEEAAVKRSQLVIGVNEVTKSLERGVLRAVVVCLSVRIPLLHEHIQFLSATRGVPCIGVHGASEAVARVLGIKSARAIGLKNISDTGSVDHFSKLATSIATLAHKINIPWLCTHKRKDTGENSTEESHVTAIEKESEANDATTPVRGKLEENQQQTKGSPLKEDLELQTETQTEETATPVNYFPAAIKKTIIIPKRKKRKK